MLWKCDDCGCLYSVDAPACPQCGGTAYALVDSGGRPVEEPPAEPDPPAPVKAPKAVKADA